MLASTADELVALARLETGDEVAPYLWSDFEWYAWLTEACDALLKRADIAFKKYELSVAAGQAVVPLPSSLLHIREARFNDGSLLQRNANEALRDSEAFSAANVSDPCVFVRDYEKRALRLVPAPNAAGLLTLQGTATIGAPMDSGMPLPTADAEDQRLLLHFMKWRAYSKHDAETEDLTRARENERLWRDGVLNREWSLRNQRRGAGGIKMTGWF